MKATNVRPSLRERDSESWNDDGKERKKECERYKREMVIAKLPTAQLHTLQVTGRR